MADQRPDVYREDGKWVFRASSFGACDQALVRQALGQTPLPPPDAVMSAYAQGNRFEPEILRGLGEFGWRILDPLVIGGYGRVDDTGQLACELAAGPRAIVRCHPDGVARCYRSRVNAAEGYRVGDTRVVEAKALKKGAWKRPLEKPQYAWQMSIEMAVTGLPGVFVVGWKTDSGVEGELHIDPVDIDPMWVDRAPYSLGQIKARARRLVKLIEAGERGQVPDCSWAMWPCGFYPSHDLEHGVWKKQETKTLPDESERHARTWVFEWRKAKAMVDKWKAKEQDARGKLETVLAEHEVDRWVGGDCEVTRVGESVRQNFDVAAAKRGGVDVEKWMKETKTKPYVRIKGLGPMAEAGAEGADDGVGSK